MTAWTFAAAFAVVVTALAIHRARRRRAQRREQAAREARIGEGIAAARAKAAARVLAEPTMQLPVVAPRLYGSRRPQVVQTWWCERTLELPTYDGGVELVSCTRWTVPA
jgi:hypothetical protein